MNVVIDFIGSWIVNIVILFIIVSIAELVMPKGNMKRYIELVIGILIVFTIISPISSIFDYDFKPKHTIYDYTKDEEMKIEEGDSFYNSQDNQIKSLVIEKMKSEIVQLVKDEEDIDLCDVDIGLDIRGEDHNIDYINITIGEEVKREDISIEKIPKVNIAGRVDEDIDASVETKEYLSLKRKVAEVFSVSSDIISIKTLEKRDIEDERDN